MGWGAGAAVVGNSSFALDTVWLLDIKGRPTN